MPVAETIPILDLQQLLDETVAANEGTLRLPKGIFRVPGKVAVSGAEGLTIEGYGCTLIFPPEGEMLQFSGCRDLTIKGLTVDCGPLPFTQGTIVSVAEDGGSFEYEVHAGYPLLVEGVRYGSSGAFVFARESRRWRQDVPDIYPSRSDVLSPTRGRISFSGNLPGYANLATGDLVAFKNPKGNAFLFRGCDTLLVEDVTVYTSPLAGFMMRCCSGPLIFRGCTITRGPKPAGASEERLLSTIADGFNVGYSRQGPVMEDCDFSWMGDDAVNLHGAIVDVVAVEGNRTIWAATRGFPEFQVKVEPGDLVRFLARDTYALKAEGVIESCQLVREPTAELQATIRQALALSAEARLYAIRLTLREGVEVAAGESLEIPATACPGFVFRNNYFHDHRARGLRLGASHGVIEGNRFERLKSSAISLGPHAIHHEGGWVRDIEVRNNIIRDVCFDDRSLASGAYNGGAIVVQHFLRPGQEGSVYPRENLDIRIIGNDIAHVGGAGILATSARRLSITGNRLSETQQVDCTETGSQLGLISTGAISLNHCQDVVLEQNQWGPAGPFCLGEVIYGKKRVPGSR